MQPSADLSQPSLGLTSPPPEVHATPTAPKTELPRSDEEAPVQTPQLFSRNPEQLNQEVARFCERARAAKDRRALATLVADLDFSGVDPASSTEALIRGNCGSPAEVVAEIVARGGEQAVAAVSDRAQALVGPKQRRRIDSAVRTGLARYADGAAAAEEAEAGGDPMPAYGMLYLPSVGEGGRVDTAMALNRLYEEAIPGYGLYTFILLGRGYGGAEEREAARYREFFRVIETYVGAMASGRDQPTPQAHAFLIPIHPGASEAPLVDQIADDLSDFMRLNLCRNLRRQGQSRLANRIESGEGPFLVTTEEPRLLPSLKSSPRLIADLSTIGPESIYGVVDAYDRPVPIGPHGQTDGLKQIRERLRALPTNIGNGDPSLGTPNDDKNTWLISLGKFAANELAPSRSSLSSTALDIAFILFPNGKKPVES